MRLVIAIGLVSSMLMGADSPKSTVTENSKALQGSWQLSSGEANGKALDESQLKDGKLVIKDDHYTVTIGKSEPISGTQKLDVVKKVNTIDITDATGANKDKTCLGIYEIDGDTFRVVFAQPGGERPSKFETKPDSKQWMHVWKREKD